MKANDRKVEQWGVFELTLPGPTEGNPFTDVTVSATFSQAGKSAVAHGFYDGDGVYRVRFMPDSQGRWSYTTQSNRSPLGDLSGSFVCTPPTPGNHGPVRVRNTHYLAYEDGTPYSQIGTTCYAWIHQTPELQERTLRTLQGSPFNKIRMCVFPKHYAYNQNEPDLYAFEGTPLTEWDTSRFNPAFFRHLERRVMALQELGIEADLILFHPYDRWGFAKMTPTDDDRYLRYIVARLAAFRNVWWSLANEFDLMKTKSMADWDRFFRIIRDHDPHGHMRGVHNCRGWYDHTKPWVTHCSIQSSDFDHLSRWRETYGKPVVIDECRYEGNIPQGWGNISAREMTRRFWLGTIGGCYVGHGETYRHAEDILWWSKGGVLHGESPDRIAFLAQVMAQAPPFESLTPAPDPAPGVRMLATPGEQYLIYFLEPTQATVDLAPGPSYKVDGIDPWRMSVTSLGSAEPGAYSLSAPRADYVLRITPYGEGESRRPDLEASAHPLTGVAPLTVRFSVRGDLPRRWTFGDGTESAEPEPRHVYKTPGLYPATVTLIDDVGQSATAFLPIAVDRDPSTPIAQVAAAEGDHPPAMVRGGTEEREPAGAIDLGGSPPWEWVRVGHAPLPELEGLLSFTIVGWLKPSSLTVGSGGNRIASNLNYNRAGFDLVHLVDGRMRLAVNEWPDRIRNDSSPGRLRVGAWTFFAVTYDGRTDDGGVCWYFGDEDTPAALDRTTDYTRGRTGRGSGQLVLGNYNETLHRHGLDRQFRGTLKSIRVFGSLAGGKGALGLNAIRQWQTRD